MFGMPPSPKKHTAFGWYAFLFIIGLGILFFSVQSSFRPVSGEQPASSSSSQSQPDELSTPVVEKQQNDQNNGSFLPEYDPKASPFLTSSPEDERPLWLSGGEFVLKLLVVIGLIYLALTGLRWLQKNRQQVATGGTTVRVLETTGLAPGRSLYLVVVGEKTLLIGATDHHLSVLTELVDVAAPLPEEALTFDETLSKAADHAVSAPAQEWQVAFDNLRGNVQRIRQRMQGNR